MLRNIIHGDARQDEPWGIVLFSTAWTNGCFSAVLFNAPRTANASSGAAMIGMYRRNNATY